MLKATVENIVKSSFGKLNIASVSEMTVDQLAEVLTDSIYKSITSKEYATEISDSLEQIRRTKARSQGSR